MNRLSSLVIAALFAAGCTPASPEQAAIREAAAALGGADRLLALKAMTIEGSGTAPNAGQNRMPDDELPVWKVSAYTRTVDLANGRTPGRQARDAQFLFAGRTRQQQTQGLDGDIAYNVTPEGAITRAGEAAARDRRIELMHHPITVVRTALDPKATIGNLRTDASQQLLDITDAA